MVNSAVFKKSRGVPPYDPAESVWITLIMTLFTLIVSTTCKPLGGCLDYHATMMVNQVMMRVIHTLRPRDRKTMPTSPQSLQ
jgi:hypothetical protein